MGKSKEPVFDRLSTFKARLLCALSGLSLCIAAAIVLTASGADAVGQAICATLALGQAGNLQLPVGTALVTSSLGDFTLRDCHL